MKKLASLVIFICLLVSVQPNISQAQLKISLGPAVGLTVPSGDYGGEASEYYLGNKYGLKPSINFGAMGKLGLGPLGFNLSILYTPKMSNSGVADPTKPNSSADVSQHLLTIGIGSQFGFGAPLVPIRPYVGLELLFSSLGGSVTFQGISNVPSSEIDMQSATRFGLGVNGGVEIKLMSTKVDVSIRYNMINLFSKSYDGSATGDRIEAYKFLNDASDPNYSLASNDKHPIANNRTIATLQFEVGVMFGF